MKEMLSIAALIIIVFACSKKIVPSASASSEQPKSESKVELETSIKETPSALVVEQGHIIYTTKCGRCHGLKKVNDYTAERWEVIIKKMAPKARLNDQESKQITAYVMANAKQQSK
ncbi:MAG: cytochrome c [Chitinophagaceae bacterium]|nr:cytochrome c [Chitinophagaceae bacterium]